MMQLRLGTVISLSADMFPLLHIYSIHTHIYVHIYIHILYVYSFFFYMFKITNLSCSSHHHINNCYWPAFSLKIRVCWWGGGLLLGLLDKTQTRSRKVKRENSDKCVKGKRGITEATMETLRGGKAPLISSLRQNICLFSLPRFKSPVPLPKCAKVVHLGSSKNT